MMERVEAKSLVKSIYLSAAALAGLDVTPQSPERLAEMIDEGFKRVAAENRRPEAVANLLQVLAAVLMHAQSKRVSQLSESTVDEGKKRVCPVYPFD